MKISCSTAEDLLPLYVDGGCSKDSKTLLEEHLQECASCQGKLKRMKSATFLLEDAGNVDETINIVAYARKVRRFRRILGIFVPAAVIVLTLIMLLAYQAILIMGNQRTAVIADVESETVNLTMGNFVGDVTDIQKVKLFTNSTLIAVTVEADTDFEGTITLWNTNDTPKPIMVCIANNKHPACTFTNLPAESRYAITIEGISDGTVTISGKVSFWQALDMAFSDFFLR